MLFRSLPLSPPPHTHTPCHPHSPPSTPLSPAGTIEEPSQLNFIYRGFVRLLNNVHLSESSYLPFSVTRMAIEQVRFPFYLSLPHALCLSFILTLIFSPSLCYYVHIFLSLSTSLTLFCAPSHSHSRSCSFLPYYALHLVYVCAPYPSSPVLSSIICYIHYHYETSFQFLPL